MEINLQMKYLSHVDRFPFHMPGHKNVFPDLFGGFDPTELPGLDNLHCPQDLLARAQHRVADIYDVRQTYFLVNGSSVGIMAAIITVARPGDHVLVPRSCHKAVLAGLIHSGAMPVWIEQEYDSSLNHWLPPGEGLIKDLLVRYPVRAVVLTNPDYYGLVPNIQGIVQLCHEAKIPVVVDEAHGAHLAFGRGLGLPLSAAKTRCDIIVQSPHKTLPALTQAAWMHVNNLDYAEALQQNLNLFHTTSPSYLLLSSLEYAGAYSKEHGAQLLRRVSLLARMLELKARQFNLQVWPENFARDWTKFTLPNRLGMEELLLGAGIYPELIQGDKVLFMLTLADAVNPSGVAALHRLLGKISKLPETATPNLLPPPAPIQDCTPRDAWLQRGKRIPIRQALGRISRQVVAPYPPGTVVVAPGQRLDSEHIDYLRLLHAGKVISEWIEVI